MVIFGTIATFQIGSFHLKIDAIRFSKITVNKKIIDKLKKIKKCSLELEWYESLKSRIKFFLAFVDTKILDKKKRNNSSFFVKFK